jgi:hypothetical protein
MHLSNLYQYQRQGATTIRADILPFTRLDVHDRQTARATSSQDSLLLNKSWDWHQVCLSLASLEGTLALILAFLALRRLEGLSTQTAADITLAGLASSCVGQGTAQLPSNHPFLANGSRIACHAGSSL